MRAHYRGYQIDVRRETCMGGWSMLYTTIMRESDGYICEELAEDSEERVRDQIQYMKERIDAEHETSDPWTEGVQ